jgi:hypothetical protein
MGAKLCKHGTVFGRCRCICPDEVVPCKPACPEYTGVQEPSPARDKLLTSVAHGLILDPTVSTGVREQAFAILERQAHRSK